MRAKRLRKGVTTEMNFPFFQYDVKKIEEVVYDISLRGLIKSEGKSEGVGFEVEDVEVARVMQLLSGAK